MADFVSEGWTLNIPIGDFRDRDRYEALELIIKRRDDGVSWFDVLSDYISGDCQGGGGECILDPCENNCHGLTDCAVCEGSGLSESDCDSHEHEPIIECTCGLESFGGMQGTLDQCYRWVLGPDYVEDDFPVEEEF